MKNINEFVNKKLQKHGKSFSLFILVGFFKTIFSIFLSWIIIDKMRITALLGSTMVVVVIFFLTYLTYLKVGLIKPFFFKYTSVTIGFNIATILLIWILVDFAGFSGALSSAIVVGSIFVLRYLVFNKVGLLKIY